MKLTTKDEQHTLFSQNYDVGSADGDDDGAMLTLNTLPVMEVLIFRVKTTVKSEVVCTNCDSDKQYMVHHMLHVYHIMIYYEF